MPVWGRRQNPDPGFHQYSSGLLQLAVLRHSSERCCTSHRWSQAVRTHHASPMSAALAASLQTSGLQDIHPVYRSLAGTTPVYLADECMLVTTAGRCLLRSDDNRTCLVKRSRNQFGDRYFATAGPTLWNSFGNLTSPSDNSNDRWKRLCLVIWAAVPRVGTLRALTRNLLAYLLTYSDVQWTIFSAGSMAACPKDKHEESMCKVRVEVKVSKSVNFACILAEIYVCCRNTP